MLCVVHTHIVCAILLTYAELVTLIWHRYRSALAAVHSSECQYRTVGLALVFDAGAKRVWGLLRSVQVHACQTSCIRRLPVATVPTLEPSYPPELSSFRDSLPGFELRNFYCRGPRPGALLKLPLRRGSPGSSWRLSVCVWFCVVAGRASVASLSS